MCGIVTSQQKRNRAGWSWARGNVKALHDDLTTVYILKLKYLDFLLSPRET